MSDDHKVCELEKQIAVLTEQAKNAAMALVLADKLAVADKTATVADKKSTYALIVSIIGILTAIVIAYMGRR
jgi:hypothetical protein